MKAPIEKRSSCAKVKNPIHDPTLVPKTPIRLYPRATSQSAARRESNTAWRIAINVRPIFDETKYSARSKCAGLRWW